jgi:arginine decarboxylase
LLRDAFFGPAESVPAAEAVHRIAAEQLTPSPPGIPVVVRGDGITAELVHYLRSGIAAGALSCRTPPNPPSAGSG